MHLPTKKEKMTRAELIELGKKIVSAQYTEAEISRMMMLFDRNVPYPTGSSLFFYPENYNHRKDNISKYDPTVEEIVDKCLAYKPTILGR